MHAGQATPKATPLPAPTPHTTPLITPLFWPDLGGKLFCQAKVWTKSCCVCCKRQRSGGKKYIKTYKTTRQRNNVKPQSQMQLKPQHSLGRRGFPRAEKERKNIYIWVALISGRTTLPQQTIVPIKWADVLHLYCFQHLFRYISCRILWRFMRPLI